jgi:magnesium-transporting ATPase (P-type)
MTFALNVATSRSEGVPGSVWDHYTPLSKLVTIAAVNNKAQFGGGEAAASGERKVFGDATDSGLLRFCDKVCDVDSVRSVFESVFSIPFNSKNKWALNMTSIPENPDQLIVMIKGAPEYVLKKCTKFYHKDQEKPIDEEFSQDMFDAYESFGTLAERVIGHAYKVCSNHAQMLCKLSSWLPLRAGTSSQRNLLLPETLRLQGCNVPQCAHVQDV